MIDLAVNGKNLAGDPYFSVILSIYNVDLYLDECIQSILDQNFQSYELILVDDGATDRSPVICDEYAKRFPQIRVIHKQNGGLSSARNAGLEIARGQYIWWVDADDWIEPDALSCLYEASVAEKPDMVKFNFYRVGQNQHRLDCKIAPGKYLGSEETKKVLREAFLFPGKFSLSAWGHIYKKEFLKDKVLSFVSERIIGSEDYLFNLCALADAGSIHVIKDPLYNYRLREGSLTQRYRKNLLEKYTDLFQKLLESYKDRGILEIYNGSLCNFYVWHLIHGTCLANEYRNTPEHTRSQGRKNIFCFLKDPAFQYAVKHCDKKVFTVKQQMQLFAMQMRIEPLFYWLFVVKGKFRKGICREN